MQKIVAENIGILLSGRNVVSIYFIAVSITPDPKKSKIGSHNPFE